MRARRGLSRIIALLAVLALGACASDEPGPDGFTPLMRAAASGDVDGVRTLLRRGADPNYQGRRVTHYSILFPFTDHTWEDVPRDSWTPLMAAAQAGQAPAIRVLLQHGADPDRVTHRGSPGVNALLLAARGGHAAAVEALLDGGSRDEPIAQRALREAIERKQLEAAHAFVVRRRGLADDPSSWHSALSTAARGGHAELVRAILAAGVDVRGPRGGTALKAAVPFPVVVAMLLAAGTDADAPGLPVHSSALALAVDGGHLESARALLDAGAAIVPAERARGDAALTELLVARGARRPDPREAELLAAARDGRARDVERLLAAGVRPEPRDDHSSRTPLMLAALGGHDAAVRLLARRGDANARDAAGQSALELAVVSGVVPAVRALLEAGAQVTPNALRLAVAREREDLERLLARRARPDAMDAALVTAAERGRVGTLARHARGRDLRLPLLAAAREGQAAAVDALLAAGASPSVVDDRGVTALMWAARSGSADAVRGLARAGADVNARVAEYRVGDGRLPEATGWTALMWAAGEKQLAAVDALLALGADREVTDSRGRKAVDYARARGAEDVAARLRR